VPGVGGTSGTRWGCPLCAATPRARVLPVCPPCVTRWCRIRPPAAGPCLQPKLQRGNAGCAGIIVAVTEQVPVPRDAFRWTSESWGPALRCEPLARSAHHLFTTRHLAIDRAGRAEGWARLARALGVRIGAVARLTQVHGAGVAVLHRGDPAPALPDAPVADIILSDRSDIAIGVQVADCVPLLLADVRTGVVAAAHAGWRGMAAGVPRVAVEALTREFGSRPEELVCAIGPSIGPCCYEVGEDVREAFRGAGLDGQPVGAWFTSGAGGRLHLDLWRATSDQLAGAGVVADRIHVCGLCTAAHRDVFYSYRGEGPTTGRMVGVIRAR
jgi:YfiH family protein